MTSRIIPILLILIALGLFFGYINPTYTGKIAALDAEIGGYENALAAAERFSNKESELLVQRESIPEDGIARIEAFLPDGVDNVQLILDLNSLASRSGLELSDFDIQAAEEGGSRPGQDQLSLESDGPAESLNITVSAVGSYAAFKTFLEGVEWSLRPLDLVELTIQDSQTGVYTYDMTFRIYWLR